MEQTEHYLLINKPPNLPIHPAGIFHDHTLWYLLQEDFPQARIVNRLDRDTSGCLVIAKRRSFLRAFHEQLRTGDVDVRATELGLGVDVSPEKARQWHTRASERGGCNVQHERPTTALTN